ncbi:MAG TPA: hypothetical protein VIX59_20745 [Candidatus Binataceae bacterium]
MAAKYKAQFAKVPTFTVDEVFGGWQIAQKTHFADGGNLRADLPAGQVKRRSVIPGFGLTIGYTLVVYLSIVVLLPLATIFIKTASLTWYEFWSIVTAPRTAAAYKLSFGAALAAALINSVFGSIVAWTLARYEFPGKSLVDGMVDLPFALPTAVAGITLTAI